MDSWDELYAAGKGELFLQVLGEQDQAKEMALEYALDSETGKETPR